MESIDLKTLGSLVTSSNVFEMLEVVIKTASEISGCTRVCFIASENRSFYIRAGIPANGHGIGEEVTREYGKIFLEQIMSKKKMTVVSNAGKDGRLSYMRNLIDKHDISAILFVPIYYKNSDIGILVIDAIGKNDFNSKLIREFSVFFSKVIGKELENQKKQEEVLQKAKHSEYLSALGSHTAAIAHTFRNKLQIIGGFAENFIEKAEKGDISNEVKLEKAKKATGIILKENRELEKFVSEILMYCKTSDCMFYERTNINEFLKEMVEALNLKKKNISITEELDRHLEQKFVYFDQRHFGVCIHDIIKNALDAGATKIFIKTVLHPEKNLFRVMIGNNGKAIPPEELDDIFSPFFTTKPTGTGLGLANVDKIIAAHGGKIEARSGDNINNGAKKGFGTLFEISMPLNR